MDAGLAAVIAGASGAGGAALAAFGTSLGLLRQAKMQGDHAHQHWLRDHQQEACQNFLVAVDRAENACRDAMKSVRVLADEPGNATTEQTTLALFEEVRMEGRNLQAAVQRIAILADEKTTQEAMSLTGRVLDVIEAALDLRIEAQQSGPLSEGRLERAQDVAAEEAGLFISRAREMLQER